MDGISVSWRLLPVELIQQHKLQDRRIERGDGSDPEYRFLYRDRKSLLPVWYGGELRIVNWGKPKPPLPWCRVIPHEDLHAGLFQNLDTEPVEIPATFGLDRGIWFPIREGVQGVMVREHDGSPVVYVVTKVSSHYYKIMCRNERQPLLIDQSI
jgi:hypothetical protein